MTASPGAAIRPHIEFQKFGYNSILTQGREQQADRKRHGDHDSVDGHSNSVLSDSDTTEQQQQQQQQQLTAMSHEPGAGHGRAR
eukprot:CAMPEP_0206534754 /NCGR_PEP_ID=MMETSP0325_2-20121206/5728_1 /ASSEMBLY_ACC=CAM_ASM_000347 /TAXON_ID=2866 /ORGANISM="Crypthecodinium cohnii, Strain Seligo" /LENGTH=83 /DNA_ID=CAMNT_0054031607 /DNA_START=276 /DNA_END=528 /DNA_ORIENTATION=+